MKRILIICSLFLFLVAHVVSEKNEKQESQKNELKNDAEPAGGEMSETEIVLQRHGFTSTYLVPIGVSVKKEKGSL